MCFAICYFSGQKVIKVKVTYFLKAIMNIAITKPAIALNNKVGIIPIGSLLNALLAGNCTIMLSILITVSVFTL